jgi:hypothetical protein
VAENAGRACSAILASARTGRGSQRRPGGLRAAQSGIHCRKLHDVQTKMRKAEWSMRRGNAVSSCTGAAHRSQAEGSPLLLRGGICGASLVQESMLIAKHPHSAHVDNGDEHAEFPRTSRRDRNISECGWEL